MHRIRLSLIAGVVIAAMVAIGAGSAASNKASAPKAGGTVTFAAEQIPPCLNNMLSTCNNTWTSWTVTTAFRGLYIEKPNFTFVPDLAASGTVISTKPETLLIKLQPKAVWSDGKPITVKDLVFTWKTIINPKWDIASRSLWDSIKTIQQVNAKTAKIIFAKPVGPWKYMLGEYGLLPEHALAGADFNNVWNDNNNDPHTGKPIASGPFMLGNYTQGQSITMVRNPKGWPHPSKLDKIVYVFRTNTDSEIQAIRGGEVDAIYPQPQLALADLGKVSSLAIQSRAGTTLEHMDYQLGPKGGPLESAPWVRQAIAYAIDRAATVKQLFATLNPKLPVLNSLTYVSNAPQYKPHFQQYTYNPAKVASIMQAHGCTKGGDGIYSCQGHRMSYKFTSTAGNKLRELAFEIFQAQAKKAGIELVSAFAPASIVFGPTVFESGNFELFMYAWVGSADPLGWDAIYECGGDQNFKGYCSRKVTKLMQQADAELDPTQRATLVNTADKNMSLNLPALPLYQKPTYLVYKKTVHGMVENPTSQEPTWNSVEWWKG
jgi:peptide/nickel transport system substrate-binding protein